VSGLPFLLEIGTEEIPDWMIQPALNDLRRLFEVLLKDNGLAAERLTVDGTPRRLVLRAEGLPVCQPDTIELVTGPPKAAAFKDGQPTGAALGFARKMGVPVDALEIVAGPKGEYLCYRRTVAGRGIVEILATALPELILKISFPKTMYWTGKGGPRFIRPIRWIVALLRGEIVPFEVAGVASSRWTSGHRILGALQCPVFIEAYEQILKEDFVLVSASERRRRIEDEIEKLLDGTGLRVKSDAGLMETLVYITEYPTPILGNFDPEFLGLPEEVLVTVMRHHQKYLSVEDANGRLAPHFIAVMNTDADPEGLVRAGNERVLRARFNDARFFWRVDQHKKLAERVEDLAQVTFQAKLGSYLDKTRRVVGLVRELRGSPPAERAALLAKCDLTTEMVKEFTELQGVMGGLYAREQGEPEEVWRAIYEHYQPVSMEDPIPGTAEGRLVSLADKLDTLRGCFAQGLVPSGSRDPFALRRAAQGVVRILVEGKLAIPLLNLLGGDRELVEFLRDRVDYYFREVRGYAYDEVRAGMAAGYSDLVDLESRLEALRAVRPTPDFEPVAASFKRIRNILRQAGFEGGARMNPQLLEPGAERELYEEANCISGLVGAYRGAKDYRAALEAIASLRPAVDRFFDKVLVNAPEEEMRQNRLTLLHQLLSEFSAIADFSEIVTTQ
jgi:glycyl-tRNA synthetase beta chain